MKGGLSEKFARLQQNKDLSNIEICLLLLKELFVPSKLVVEPTTLKVFAAGLPRSGTGSLAVALEQLGYSPCHGPCALDLAPILTDHNEGRATNEDLIRWQEEHGYDAQGLDAFGHLLYKEAVQLRPDAKIILTEHPRGAAAWAESWSSFAPDHLYYFSCLPFSLFNKIYQAIRTQQHTLLLLGGTEDPRDSVFKFPAQGLVAANYEKHNEDVKRFVPADRLLVFDPTQGWEPLCNFLDIAPYNCPIHTPYPHMTDRQMMIVLTKVIMVITWVWTLAPLYLLFLIIYFYRRREKRRKRKIE